LGSSFWVGDTAGLSGMSEVVICDFWEW
jgi:hypothetical protein